MAAAVGPAGEGVEAEFVLPVAGAGETRDGGEALQLGVVLEEGDLGLPVELGEVADPGAASLNVEEDVVGVGGVDAEVLVDLAELVLLDCELDEGVGVEGVGGGGVVAHVEGAQH